MDVPTNNNDKDDDDDDDEVDDDMIREELARGIHIRELVWNRGSLPHSALYLVVANCASPIMKTPSSAEMVYFDFEIYGSDLVFAQLSTLDLIRKIFWYP
jgi:hypothetical protein